MNRIGISFRFLVAITIALAVALAVLMSSGYFAPAEGTRSPGIELTDHKAGHEKKDKKDKKNCPPKGHYGKNKKPKKKCP